MYSSSTLSLTPPPTADGPFANFGQQGGLPFETNWNPSYNNKDADSFDRSEDDDGLMGLGALRERAQSSPGPMHSFSSSPPVRIDVNPYQQGDLSPLPSDGSRYLPPDPRRPRPSSYKGGGNARPPLSGQSSAAFLDNSFNSSGNFGGRNSPGSSNNDVSYDYSPPGGRSDMVERLQGGSRSRALGAEDFTRSMSNEQQFRHQQQHTTTPMDQLSHTQKFGSLPSLSQQRFPAHQMQQQPNRHIRSYSHSGALQHYGLQEMHDDGSRRGYDHVQQHQQQQQQHGRMQHQRLLHSDGSDGMFVGGNDSWNSRGFQQTSSNLPRSLSVGDNYSSHSAPGGGSMPRSVSMNQTSFQQGFDSQPSMQRRNSEQFPQQQQQQYAPAPPRQQQMYPSLQRRDEFIGSSDSGPAPIMATAEELLAYNIQDERGRGSQQQQPQRYPSPSSHSSRRPADFVPMSSSPMSAGQMRSGGRYVVQSHAHRSYGNSGQDDDLTHPLAGELIDDPGDDPTHGLGNNSSMMQNVHHAPQVHYRSAAPSSMAQHYVTMDAVHLAAPAPRLVYNVKFKRTQRNFIIGPRVARDLKIGCYVKVEADRGEDLGIVVSKVAAEKFNSAGRSSFRTAGGSPGGVGDMNGPGMPSSSISDLKRIMRLATQDEVALLTIKREEEEELLKICRTKVRQRALPMHVVDAEYQFDRHKLTFFFEAEGRIDFRELVRDLFSMYKTRIWMQQLDKNTPTILAPIPDYNTLPLNQVPVMADSINEPYGISSDPGAGINHSN